MFRNLLLKIKLSSLKSKEKMLFDNWLLTKHRGDILEDSLKHTRAEIMRLEMKIRREL